MDGDDFFWCVFEDMRRPEGAVDVGAEVLEFGGHAAIEDADVLEDCLLFGLSFCLCRFAQLKTFQKKTR